MIYLPLSEDLYFPTEADMSALVDELPVATLNTFLASAGIFVSANKSEKPTFVQRFAFSRQWYRESFQAALTPEQKRLAITGVRCKISQESSVESWLNENCGKILSRSIKYSPRIIYSQPDGANLRLKIEYEVSRPSKVTLLSKEKISFELFFRKLSDSKYEFYCNPSSSREGMIAREIVDEITRDKTVLGVPSEVDMTSLSPEDTLKLFSSIFDDLGGTWRVRDVSGLTVVSPTGKEQHLGKPQVKHIRSAVLHGTKLNSDTKLRNMFEGYLFTAAEFSVFRTGVGVLGDEIGDCLVAVVFKRSPRILEVSIEQFSTDAIPVPNHVATEVCNYFWDKVYTLFEQLVEQSASGSKSVDATAVQPSATPPTSGQAPTTTTTN